MVAKLIKRSIFNQLELELSQPEILILLGARQVGKTTLLYKLEKICKQNNKKVIFFDLEQPEDLKKLSGDSENIIKTISLDTDYIFIDEFYYLKNAGQIFKAIFDKAKRQNKKIKIIASGSSSIEIHTHIKESLAGRMLKYSIFPLTFSEYKKIDKSKFSKYLKYGGLPGTVYNSNERIQQQLNDYISSYILKDVKSLVKEENIRSFNNLIYHLASSQGQLVEYQSLAREVGLSGHTIKNYIDILEQTYVNFPLNSYHSNLSNELKKSKKQYFYDLGVRNSILKDFRNYDERQDKGTILESFVFLQLKYNCPVNCEIRFWRNKDKKEVDFILVKNRVPYPIEVKSNLKKPNIPSGLKSFLNLYKNTKTAYVVNLNIEDEIKYNNSNVKFIKFDSVERIYKEIS